MGIVEPGSALAARALGFARLRVRAWDARDTRARGSPPTRRLARCGARRRRGPAPPPARPGPRSGGAAALLWPRAHVGNWVSMTRAGAGERPIPPRSGKGAPARFELTPRSGQRFVLASGGRSRSGSARCYPVIRATILCVIERYIKCR